MYSIHVVYKRLKELREKHNFSQEYLGDQLGLSQSSYNRLETGLTRIRLDTLYILAEILETDVVSLLLDDDEKSPRQAQEEAAAYIQSRDLEIEALRERILKLEIELKLREEIIHDKQELIQLKNEKIRQLELMLGNENQ